MRTCILKNTLTLSYYSSLSKVGTFEKQNFLEIFYFWNINYSLRWQEHRNPWMSESSSLRSICLIPSFWERRQIQGTERGKLLEGMLRLLRQGGPMCPRLVEQGQQCQPAARVDWESRGSRASWLQAEVPALLPAALGLGRNYNFEVPTMCREL